MKKQIAIALGVAAAAVSLLVAATSASANSKAGVLTIVGKGGGYAYVSNTGKVSSKYPGGILVTGDRVFAHEEDYIGGKAAGFDNEICTVTFTGNDYCHDVAVFPGRGEIELTYLMVGRNYIRTATGLTHFTGIIDGGTGEFQNAHGAFQATALPNGLQVTVPLG